MVSLGGEYEIKRTILLEKVLREIGPISRKAKDTKGLNPNLLDSEEEKGDDLEEIIVNRRANIEYVNDLLQTIVSEINSSSIQVIRLIENASKSSDEKRLQLSIIRNNWESNIQIIIARAQKEIPELGKVLEMQERQIYGQIEDVLQEYRQIDNKEQSNEHSNANSSEEFRDRIKQGVNVDERLALENMGKASKENILKLDPNLLE